MNATLEQFIYGIAYRNHLFEKGEYFISFFHKKRLRDEFYNSYKEEVGTEILKFKFRIKDCVTDG